ncbi:MAG: DUF1259 domain-containing protein [Bacillota bacterium]
MPSQLCREFSRIIGGRPGVVNGVCVATAERDLSIRILGRKTDSALALYAFFSFEALDAQGRALNLGETVVLEREANPFISALRRRGLKVTALHNHWLFDSPRTLFVHFEAIKKPLQFARDVRAAFRVIGGLTPAEAPEAATGQCLRFARILGGMGMKEGEVCRVMRNRNLVVRILGRRSRSPLVLAPMFSFESKDAQGRTLNLGESPLLESEVNTVISRLRRRGLKVTSEHNHWLFERPRIMFVHFESVENPIRFARKAAASLRGIN